MYSKDRIDEEKKEKKEKEEKGLTGRHLYRYIYIRTWVQAGLPTHAFFLDPSKSKIAVLAIIDEK